MGCRKQRPQNDLIRLARLVDGSVIVDDAHRAGGRGAYVCSDEKCAVRAVDSGRLRRALRCDQPIGGATHGELLHVIASRKTDGARREADG